MPATKGSFAATLPRDLTAGLVVFLVALPLCLGVALASNAPLFSGLVAGIVGGILVGLLSGSHASVSGPAAGLTAVVAAQIATLGSFEAFLLAVVLAGLIQIVLGIARAGFIAAFVPSSVIKGLLAAIGVILILKQIPHVLGHDPDPEGDMAFLQPDRENTFSELFAMLGDIHPGAAAIGLAVGRAAGRLGPVEAAEDVARPAPTGGGGAGRRARPVVPAARRAWVIGPSHLVQVPVADSLAEFLGFLRSPDFSQWRNPAVYFAAVTIAAVASLETLLNLEAVDKIDPQQRVSPPSRELLAQGVGNVVSGLLGGLPVTTVIIRSSVNINAGGRTRLATIVHGVLLLVSVVLLPTWLNLIPLSCLAAILLVTGCQAGQPGAGEADVGRGGVSVHPLRGDGGGHRPDRPAGRRPDRAGGEHRLHPPQQHAPSGPPVRGEAPGRRGAAHRAGQPGELPEPGGPAPPCSTGSPAAATCCSTRNTPTTSTPTSSA